MPQTSDQLSERRRRNRDRRAGLQLLLDASVEHMLRGQVLEGRTSAGHRRVLLRSVVETAVQASGQFASVLAEATSIDRPFEFYAQTLSVLSWAGTLAMVGVPTGRDEAPLMLAEDDEDALVLAVGAQLAYLDRWKDQIRAGLADAAKGANRARLYAMSVWSVAWSVVRDQALRARIDGRKAHVTTPIIPKRGLASERLVLSPEAHHCGDCPRDAAAGWQPVGSMRPIGDRTCQTSCMCHFEYR